MRNGVLKMGLEFFDEREGNGNEFLGLKSLQSFWSARRRFRRRHIPTARIIDVDDVDVVAAVIQVVSRERKI